ncbi:hypothetical protein SCHPADRAFT_556594 [Schizopora paradoxa]|uniref:DUF6533 domain-containing protein n=1 Tax=Schizopora paradoxa TaxID=27342 RepID=A0A0H2RXZ9_9AGAM|nr:hypothetical protein SCHPADRAFT_556594 [Schizopora paradoxa]
MAAILLQTAEYASVMKLTMVANITLAFFEYGIKLDDEIKFLWMRKKSFASALLFLCRYLPIALSLETFNAYLLTDGSDISSCFSKVSTNAYIIYIQFMLSLLVLLTRAYAVWGTKRNLLLGLAVMYAVAAAGTAYAVHRNLEGFQTVGLTVGTGCIFFIDNKQILIALVIHIGCEAVALSLLLFKAVEHARAMQNIHIHRGNAKACLMTIIARDGLGYFVINLSLALMNVIVLERVEENWPARVSTFDTRDPTEYLLQSTPLPHPRNRRGKIRYQ